jgi:acyl carrier protein
MSVRRKVRRHILSMIDTGPDRTLDPDLDLLESGLMDSFMLMDLLAWIEERFNLRIDDEHLVPENFATLNRISDYLENRRSRKARSIT